METTKVYLKFLNNIEKLKCHLRHSWTSSGRQESVAEHSWRTALMAMIFSDECSEVDMRKVMEMLIIHDLGEVFEGDTPAFNKTSTHTPSEKESILKVVAGLPPKIQQKITSLWDEFDSGTSLEAKIAHAIDKMEAVIQHNEADISTWTPIEHDMNLVYGEKEADCHPFLKEIRGIVRKDTEIKRGIK